jgi:hypothetical protein
MTGNLLPVPCPQQTNLETPGCCARNAAIVALLLPSRLNPAATGVAIVLTEGNAAELSCSGRRVEQRLPLSNSSAFTLIALICSVLPFVERCMSHSDLEMARDA